jgi:hypothetical protein
MLENRQASPSKDRDGLMAARPNRDTVVADSGTDLFREIDTRGWCPTLMKILPLRARHRYPRHPEGRALHG